MIDSRPLVALTLGDVAGVGPEIVAKAWSDDALHALARPFVIGGAGVIRRGLQIVGGRQDVVTIRSPEEAAPSHSLIPCLEATTEAIDEVPIGRVDRRAGRAAYDFLIAGIDLALSGRVDALVTLPLNKESLAAAGILHPGHTEILAERCGTPDHAMMLYLSPRSDSDAGFGVIHATLHVALRRIFDMLTVGSIHEKIALADRALLPLTGGRRPRIAVAGLNPHAGENGLFGDEELTILTPAIARARAEGIDVVGPIAADTLFARAIAGEFDAVVAMYHDQGHVALKTLGFDRAVNVTLGLPIVRTSVAHGTAFDITGRGIAETTSLIEAVRVAARLVAGRRDLASLKR